MAGRRAFSAFQAILQAAIRMTGPTSCTRLHGNRPFSKRASWQDTSALMHNVASYGGQVKEAGASSKE